ncbi:FAD-NAD(P)-binding-domain-containing protein [Whalleya microplaca]|nr:FAD-NAD(P)-binding-domain-containing protein [Whalleya microplaca]
MSNKTNLLKLKPNHKSPRSIDGNHICRACKQKRDVADVLIIGAGAAGVAVALSVLQKAREAFPIQSLVMVDKSDDSGAGLAYSYDTAGLISNRRAETMSLIHGRPWHFATWLTEHQLRGSAYVERDVYGKYLREMLSAINHAAWELKMDFRLIREEVVDLDFQMHENKTMYKLLLEEGSCLYAKKVVLALGNYPAVRHEHLLKTPKYFPRPWPTGKIQDIPLGDTVGVIGTSSSAIDVVRILHQRGHWGAIYMMSRSGNLPRVEGPSHHFPRTYALHTLVRELEQGNASLPESNRRLAFERQNLERESTNDLPTSLAHLRGDIQKAERDDVEWQAMFNALRPIVERHWNALLADGWQSLREKYQHHLYFHRETMPIDNARILEELMEKGQLKIIQGKGADFDGKNFLLGTKNHVRVDYLIEATGLEFDIRTLAARSRLINQMMSKRLIQRDYFGGIKVGFKDLKVSHGLYAIGSLTKGTHFLVEGIDRIACHASRVADSVVGLQPSQSLQVALFVGLDLFSALTVMQLVPRLLAMGHMPFVFLVNPLNDSIYVSKEETMYHFFEYVLLPEVIIPHYKSVGGPTAVALMTDSVENEFGVLVKRFKEINNIDFRAELRINGIDVGFFIGCKDKLGDKLRDAFKLYSLRQDWSPSYHDVRQTLKNDRHMISYGLEYLEVGYNRLVREKYKKITKSVCACGGKFDCYGLGVELLVEAVDEISRGQELTDSPMSMSSPRNDTNLEEQQHMQLVDVPSMLQRILTHFATPETEEGLTNAIRQELKYWDREFKDSEVDNFI